MKSTVDTRIMWLEDREHVCLVLEFDAELLADLAEATAFGALVLRLHLQVRFCLVLYQVQTLACKGPRERHSKSTKYYMLC